ncbi:MAG: hypothetical protein ACE5H3_09890 [Planctomycetota bacterium]
MPRNSAPVLLETLAMALVAGLVLLTLALPVPARAKTPNVPLRDGLAVIRSAVFRFQMDHHDPLGGLLPPGRENADVVAQLTGRSRGNGTTDLPRGRKDDRWFGPYLARIPVNPVNGLATIRLEVQPGSGPLARGTAGWIYDPRTGRVFADLPAADERGVDYMTY